MNPLLLEALGAIVRHLLTIAAGWLVAQGVWSQSQADSYVGALASALTVALIAIGWSLYSNYRKRLKLNLALATPTITTEAEVENRLSMGVRPTVRTPKTISPMLVKFPDIKPPSHPPAA